MAENTIYNMEGIVHKIDDPQKFSDFFTKQSFVVLKQSTFKDKVYEDFITFDCVNNGMNNLVGVYPGHKVNVSFVLQGKESKNEAYKGKFFNTLKAIKIQTLEVASPEQRTQQTFVASQEKQVNSFVEENTSLNPSDGPDDLPF